MKKWLPNIAGIVLGLLFVMASVMFFLNLGPKPTFPEGSPISHFFAAFGPTGYLKFVKLLELIGGVVVMIPQFVLFAKLPAFGFQGSRVWTNTFLPLIVPAFTGSAFYIFLLRQFMRGIPMELSEAARIDGASEFNIWWSIIMPLTRPALATVAIFQFQGAWQDFMGPLLYLQSEKLYTLQLGLRQFEAAAGGAPAWNWLMAASLMVMLPVLIVFVALQRNFIEGISLSGMGGR